MPSTWYVVQENKENEILSEDITIPSNANSRNYFGYSVEGNKLRQRAIEKKICAWCSKPFTNKRVKYYCGEEGIIDCASLFYNKHSVFWGKYQLKTLERDNYRCKICYGIAKIAHHIIPISKGGGIFNLDNLMSVCSNCHKYIHSKKYNMVLVIPESILINKKITDYIIIR